MPRIRCLEIDNFRSIKKLQWYPGPGINCLIGPGDSGKSSILEAIDLCLGSRRNIEFTDADFHKLDVDSPINILVTIGELDDHLKSLDSYGNFLRGFIDFIPEIQDEPEDGSEIVLTIQLEVNKDLEPSWKLYSDRGKAQGQSRHLSWTDRAKISPARIGTIANYDLSWRKGSVLNRLSDERADPSATLAKVSRDARSAFGDEADTQLIKVRKIVATTAKDLGVPTGNEVKAKLDLDSLSFGGGAISLHDEAGIPLKNLGAGSTRLLVAGLQRRAAEQANILLIDELEHGLEPHRTIRLVDSLGAKEETSPLQVFMATHSPVAVRELSGDQLYVVRRQSVSHEVKLVGTQDEIQGTIRSYPEAFLAPSIIVCEGASEIGLMRGLDQHYTENSQVSIAAEGVALVDAKGAQNIFKRALAFQSLGYRTSVLRDDDIQPTPDLEKTFIENEGQVFSWRAGRKLEDEIFTSFSDSTVRILIEKATSLHNQNTINSHLDSASKGTNLKSFKGLLNADLRAILGKAANMGWFKTVSHMEAIAKDILGPNLSDSEKEFQKIIKDIFDWTHDEQN